jgi:hypothetical protein
VLGGQVGEIVNISGVSGWNIRVHGMRMKVYSRVSRFLKNWVDRICFETVTGGVKEWYYP